MVADAIFPITWCNLCLPGDMCVISCWFTQLATVGIFARMHYPGCVSQTLPQPGLELVPSSHSILLLSHGKGLLREQCLRQEIVLFKSLHIPGIILAKFKHFALVVCNYSSHLMVLLKGIALFIAFTPIFNFLPVCLWLQVLCINYLHLFNLAWLFYLQFIYT